MARTVAGNTHKESTTMARFEFSDTYFTIAVKTVRFEYRYLHGQLMSQTKEERETQASRSKELRSIWKARKFKTEQAAKQALGRLEKRFPGVAGWYVVTEAMDLGF
jgi:hypothetical protein